MIDVILRPAAAADTNDAYRWYEGQRKGLGHDFLAEVSLALDLIASHPLAFPVIRRHTRRALLRRFPYQILYRAYSETVIVVAVFHASREPRACQRRT